MNFNNDILQIINTMPVLGGYDTKQGLPALERACAATGGKLIITPSLAQPSYCTVATYLIFLQVVQKYFDIDATPGLPEALAVHGEDDGVGIWGRWDANGPATPCLFYQLNLGTNFTDWNQAQKGDFIKISWNGLVGKDEHGHSAIFMGTETVDGVETVSYWSSNTGKGYCTNTRPRADFPFVIFSRLESPENIAGALTLPRSDPYLTGLESQASTQAEALAHSGINA